MKNKKFIKNYLYNLMYQVLVLLVPLVTTPYVSRVLGAEAIGEYGYTSGIVSYFAIIGALGIVNYGQREIAYYQTDKYEYSKIFFELIIMRFFMLMLISVFYFLFILLNNKYQTLYIIQGITVFSWFFDFNWFLQGLEEFKFLSIRNTFIKIVSTIAIFIFVKVENDLYKYVFILSLSLFISNLSSLGIIKDRIRKVKISDLTFRKHVKPILIMFSSVVAVQIYTVLDQTMLGLYSTITEVGYYIQAQKIVKIVLTIISSIAVILLPRIASLYVSNSYKEIESILKSSFRYLFCLSFFMMVISYFFANSFVPIFFGSGYEKVIVLLKLLSVIYPILGLGQILGSILNAMNHQLDITKAVFCGAIINFVLNTIMIPSFDSVGAIIASIISEFVVTLLQLRILSKHFEITKFIFLIKNYFWATVSTSITLYIINLINLSDITKLILNLVVGSGCYLLILLLLKDEMVYTIFRGIKKFRGARV